jgi:hypothetical protein
MAAMVIGLIPITATDRTIIPIRIGRIATMIGEHAGMGMAGMTIGATGNGMGAGAGMGVNDGMGAAGVGVIPGGIIAGTEGFVQGRTARSGEEAAVVAVVAVAVAAVVAAAAVRAGANV